MIPIMIEKTIDGKYLLGALELQGNGNIDEKILSKNICATFNSEQEANIACDMLNMTMWRVNGIEISPKNIEHEVFKYMTMLKPSIHEAFDCESPQEETLEMNVDC